LLLAAILFPAPGPAGQEPRVTIDGDRILIDGVPTFLKGICYSPFIAGEAPWSPWPLRNVDFAADLREIKDVLHANFVRIYDPLPKEFYDAAREAGLWVIQGFFIPDPPGMNLLDPAYVNAQKADLATKIRDIHTRGGSDVILAYAIGNGLRTEIIAHTIKSNQGQNRFVGTHYSAPEANELPPVLPYRLGNAAAEDHPCCGSPPAEDACGTKEGGFQFCDPHPFQSFLAMLADHAASEDIARGSRHLIGYAATPVNNPFLGARDRSVPAFDAPVDMSFLDVIFENVYSFSIAYTIYEGVPAYLRRLKVAYPQKPVVVLETGYSTSDAFEPLLPALCGFRDFPDTEPLAPKLRYGGAEEAEQAAGIETRWVDVVTAPRPFAGFGVYSFYEEWWLGGDQNTQLDHPGAFFGLKRVRTAGGGFNVTEKPAYSKVAAIYGCDDPSADPAACGVVIRTPRLIEGTFDIPIEEVLAAAGGTPPYRWEIDDSALLLPPGVSFDAAAGRLEGVPERMGEFRFRIRVTDSGAPARTAERLTVLRVGPPVFSTRGREILMNGEPFFLKGLDYSPFIAGDAPWSCMRVADPFDDLREIRELGANSIRTYQTLPKAVYDAARENGLFIVQGIHLQVDVPQGVACETLDLDLFRDNFEAHKAHVLAEIDEVHNVGGGDVVLCHVVGNEISFCAQRQTICKNQARPRYDGRFYDVPPPPARLPACDAHPGCAEPEEEACPELQLPPGACFPDPHPFQSYVTELVDLATAREVDRWGARHLMTHATDPNMSITPSLKDRLEPHAHLPVDLGFLDLVCQNVYSYFPPAIRFLGYRKYLEQCAVAYPDKPFLILECGYSTSPERDAQVGGCATPALCGQPTNAMPGALCFGANVEAEQAQGLLARWQEVIAEPVLVSGFFIFEYYDEWWKGANASEYCKDKNRVEEWFGVRSVTNDAYPLCLEPKVFTIRDKAALETVRTMFSSPPDPGGFRRGDSDTNGAVNITDAVRILNVLFLGIGTMTCDDASDSDDNGAVNITDAVRILNVLFLGIGVIPSPGNEACGPDPSDDALECADYPADSC
jgi:hypothetical protein